jgi:hypothetical protein
MRFQDFGGSSPSPLFSALDGRRVSASHHQWRVTVFSVYEEGGQQWVQLGLHGYRDYTLTLCLGPEEGAGDATAILSSWLANPASTSHIRNVA